MNDLEKQLASEFGIVFKDKSLLEMAFTHTSYANEHRLLKVSHNERLEFLGDAVLQLIISNYLYQKYPKKPEGQLSKMRATIVREESLASFSKTLGFDRHIKLGRGEEKSGGRSRATILGDLFEAFLGALLLDTDFQRVESFVNQVMIPKIEEGDFKQVKDYKTSLQEFLQVEGSIKIDYQLLSEEGPAHQKTFEVAVVVNQKTISRGVGKSKKLAEQAAAQKALDFYKRGS